MEDSGGGDGSGGGRHGWFERRTGSKRNFSTMAASHRDDSPDSLFLPSNHHHRHDPHYNNEHSTRRRRIQSHLENQRERERSLHPAHYSGDGLDFRRPVMSTRMRETSVSDGHVRQSSADDANVSVAAAPAAVPAEVIDLTDEHEEGSEGVLGSSEDVEVTGASDRAGVQGSSRAGGGQRLPRFGRDVLDVEDHDQRNTNVQPPADQDDEVFAQLPGANYLALPPRRSASGRVQYSLLRRPPRPPSPPQEMDEEEIEYLGARPFANVQERRPTPGPAGWLNNNTGNVRSVTPYPTMDAPIDLTGEADDMDDDVLFVDERRRSGVNAERPNANAGARTQAGGHAGFGIGHIANMLRDQGAALGGRLAQRVQNFGYFNSINGVPTANMNNEQLRRRAAELEEEIRTNRELRDQARRELRRTGGHARVRRVHMDANGNIPGYQAVGWFAGPPHAPGPARPGPNLGDIGGMMDYGMAAFNMGYDGVENRNRPPTPKYSPPPEPEDGFTRNPGEDEVVVCPNCGDELAVGEEESKQEIWVNKGCGHAYCGNCTQHRSKTKNKKGKGRAVDTVENLPPPFRNCVVEGCGKSTNGKNMVRVYFGS